MHAGLQARQKRCGMPPHQKSAEREREREKEEKGGKKGKRGEKGKKWRGEQERKM